MTEQQASLQELMALDFKLYDLQLYLNTHPFDGEILELYQDLSKEAQTAKTKYESLYGALSPTNAATDCEWTWINNPWPWERKV